MRRHHVACAKLCALVFKHGLLLIALRCNHHATRGNQAREMRVANGACAHSKNYAAFSCCVGRATAQHQNICRHKQPLAHTHSVGEMPHTIQRQREGAVCKARTSADTCTVTSTYTITRTSGVSELSDRSITRRPQAGRQRDAQSSKRPSPPAVLAHRRCAIVATRVKYGQAQQEQQRSAILHRC